MQSNLIVAVSRNGVIGLNNQMPWHIPEDLKFFKHQTSEHPIIMGRKTFEGLGRALPNRTNIVITRSTEFSHNNVIVARSREEANSLAEREAKKLGVEQYYIIGGAEIYRLFLATASKVLLTRIHQDYEGDSFFDIKDDEWEEDVVVISSDKEGDIPAFTIAEYVPRQTSKQSTKYDFERNSEPQLRQFA